LFRLTTARLEIRRFADVDPEPYIEALTNPEVTKFLGTGKPMTREEVIRMISRFEAICDSGYGIYAVAKIASGKVIGHCGIRPIPDGRIELLYAYAESAWGKGYATEAGRAVLDYGLEHFAFDEIIAMAYPQNPGSIGVMKKLGFSRLGQEEHFGTMLEVYTLRK